MKWLLSAVLWILPACGMAQVCELEVDATAQMRFAQNTLVVDQRCTEIAVTLHNRGSYPLSVMGHDWVLTKSSEAEAVANAGMDAGPDDDYQKPNDPRIIASTKLIGGGESATVRFSPVRLERDTEYSFFCSAPGHYGIMKGRFVYNPGNTPAVANSDARLPDSRNDP